MTPERLAEITEAAARWMEGDLKNPTTTSVFRHRAELLAEVDRLIRQHDADIERRRTALHKAMAERDQARRILRSVRTVAERWRTATDPAAWIAAGQALAAHLSTLAGDPLPDWLTDASQEADSDA